MKTAFFVLVCVILTAVFGCNEQPLPVTPTADNPCGEAYVPCLNMQGTLNGYCCNENETCGGGKYSVGCPVNCCCDIDNYVPDMGVERTDAGQPVSSFHVKHPQLHRTSGGAMEFVPVQ